MAFKIGNGSPSVRFEGFNEEKRRHKNTRDVVVSKRLVGLLIFLLSLTFILASRLAYIQLTQQSLYEAKLDKYGTSTYTRDANRGEIVDRNGIKLVNNTNISNAIYYAPKSITKDEIETTANFLTDNITMDVSAITFRQKKDFFIIACPEIAKALVSKEERAELEGQEDASKQIDNKIIERITEELMNEHMDEKLLKNTRFVSIMKQTTSGSSVLIENLSVEDASKIGSNAVLLKGVRVSTDWSREYPQGKEFTRVLGRVTTKKQGIPEDQKEQLVALDYQNDARIGVSGLELQYEDILRGTDTKYTITYDDEGNPIPVYTNLDMGQNGSNLRISIDWELQEYANQVITDELIACNNLNGNQYFDRMFLILMDPNNGDIIVMAGKQIDKETGEVVDYAAGNYQDRHLIGSTTKGGTIYTALKEGIIKPGEVLLDEPIKLKGTKIKQSWEKKRGLGPLDEIGALARSSNVYMFRIAMKMGGTDYVYDGPLSIKAAAWDTYRQDVGELGLGVKTGLDVTDEQVSIRGKDPLPGNFLDLVIGQYDTYTNIQLAQYTSTIANGGKRIQPRLLLDAYKVNEDGSAVVTYEKDVKVLDDVSEQAVAFQRVKEGYRACVTRSDGLCKTPWSTKGYVSYAKTGTAEIYDYNTGIDHPNHLTVGWADDAQGKPKIVFSAICYRQMVNPNGGDSSASTVSAAVMDKYYEKYPN